ncbi:MAG: bifunctional diaminohydroxyphosphoribosylaminopyrimidine deaminase/5-amino-6-(5-phosphoribosylamino)uracil reductase RibD [Candidatus Dormibacteria bacterium]
MAPPSELMSRAIALAARARHSTSPNPMVGVVLARGEEVVGEGFHRRAGGPHAEVVALRAAGDRARGATAYVTLEPCAHHGRTGPCADALVAAGVSRVVVAHEDPYPAVRGRGIRRLREAGLQVELGDGVAQARSLNVAWLRAAEAARPFVALKYAATLDGKTASTSGDSRWITGEGAREMTHRLRAAYDAVAVGAGTAITDDPQLNARPPARRRRQPLRVVVDGRLRSAPGARIHDRAVAGGSVVLASTRASARRLALFARHGVDVEVLESAQPGGADLLRALSARGVSSLLVEGGGDLAWTFVTAGLVDRVYAFFGPMLLGGKGSASPVSGSGFGRLAEALHLEVVNVRRLGPDVLVEAVAA